MGAQPVEKRRRAPTELETQIDAEHVELSVVQVFQQRQYDRALADKRCAELLGLTLAQTTPKEKEFRQRARDEQARREEESKDRPGESHRDKLLRLAGLPPETKQTETLTDFPVIKPEHLASPKQPPSVSAESPSKKLTASLRAAIQCAIDASDFATVAQLATILQGK